MRPVPRPSLRGVFIVAVTFLAAWHLVAVTLASLPPNRYSAAAQPATAHLAPYFAQNWRLFAPKPVASDRSVRFQGAWEEDGQVRTTAWVDWTDVELDLVRQRVVGGRAGYVTNKMHTPLAGRYGDLDVAQREVVDGGDPAEVPPWEELRSDMRALSDDAQDDLQVEAYLRYDRAATRLGGSVLSSRWPGHEWVSVRYAVRSQGVTPWTARELPAAQRQAARPEVVQRINGWRRPVAAPAAERAAVADFDRRHR